MHQSEKVVGGALAAALVLVACAGQSHDRVARATTTTIAPATTTSTSAPAPPRALQPTVDAAVAHRPVPVSVVAIDLTNGERGEHLAGRVVLSASLYKLFVARELFRRIVAGSLARGDASGDGRHTVDECLRLMIVESDDGCGVAGLNMVGKGALDPSLRRDGFSGTSLASPQRTTAADVAELLVRERVGDTELYGLLRRQQVNDRIPPALPPGTPIAHKTGDRTGWAHDAAVVTTPKGDVVVVVLTGPWPSPCCHEERIGPLEREAFALIGAVARRVYDAVAT